MRFRLLLQIASRFLRGRGNRLLDGTARSALIGTIIGVAAMVVAMALMTGYREDLLQKITRGSAAILVYPLNEDRLVGHQNDLRDLLEGLAHVDEVRRVTYGQGAISSSSQRDSLDVGLRGVDSLDGVAGLGAVDTRAQVRPDVTAVLLGVELAEALKLQPDEVIRLMVLGVNDGKPKFGYESVQVVGTFRSGFAEFDSKLVVIERDRLEALAGAGVGESVFELAVPDLNQTSMVARAADEALGPDFLVVDWRELNPELLTALSIQKIALFMVLGLIVLVSTFNVASNLVVLVRERMRDVGVLAALGLGPSSLRRLFLIYGGGLSLLGLVAGVGVGWLISWALTRFEIVSFGGELAEIYFISAVPFRVRLADVAAIVLFTAAVTAVACWIPARRGSRVLPADALRYE